MPSSPHTGVGRAVSAGEHTTCDKPDLWHPTKPYFQQRTVACRWSSYRTRDSISMRESPRANRRNFPDTKHSKVAAPHRTPRSHRTGENYSASHVRINASSADKYRGAPAEHWKSKPGSASPRPQDSVEADCPGNKFLQGGTTARFLSKEVDAARMPSATDWSP